MTNQNHTGSGKWSQAGVPHKGWTCFDIEDLGSPLAICEMCERKEIRFIHHMSHPDYPDALRVGCDCAGHMEEDLVGAEKRDKIMRNASGRRARWLTRRWNTSVNGNSYLNAYGYNVVAYRQGATWGFRVKNRVTDDGIVSKKPYPSEDAAKLRAFDAISWMQARGR